MVTPQFSMSTTIYDILDMSADGSVEEALVEWAFEAWRETAPEAAARAEVAGRWWGEVRPSDEGRVEVTIYNKERSGT